MINQNLALGGEGKGQADLSLAQLFLTFPALLSPFHIPVFEVKASSISTKLASFSRLGCYYEVTLIVNETA